MTVTGDTATYWGPSGQMKFITPTETQDIRAAILDRALSDAVGAGVELDVIISGDRGEHRVAVTPDGQVRQVPDPDPPTNPTPVLALPTPTFAAVPAEHVPSPPALRRRVSFVTTEPAPPRPHRGIRGLLAAAGLPVTASRQEREHWESVQAVSSHWAGCRVVAVGNGKGGAGKTMTTAMLAAVFARHGGAGVLAWDNNDTRGTLGWRTEQGAHQGTVQDLLPSADHLLAPDAGAGQIAEYVHHQRDDKYDVLRSNPHLLAVDQRIGAAEFDRLMQVAVRYYRMVIFDSGNDESADRWLRMVDHAHQLVIPTSAAPDAAESAVLLLEELQGRDAHSAKLAEEAVVIVSHPEQGAIAQIQRVVAGFRELGVRVETIPFDPALKSGPLRFAALRKDTKRAWIAAAAATTKQLD
ncbi:AAA family ATPase [Microbacterium immunditiarum]|uniref:AAA family ATPase n=1 Tax=Microbacterium immunditiarum TaxID=337480 RepID=UPI0015CC3A59